MVPIVFLGFGQEKDMLKLLEGDRLQTLYPAIIPSILIQVYEADSA